MSEWSVHLKPGHIFDSPVMNSETKFRPICWKAVDVHKHTHRFQTTLSADGSNCPFLTPLDSQLQRAVPKLAPKGFAPLSFSMKASEKK